MNFRKIGDMLFMPGLFLAVGLTMAYMADRTYQSFTITPSCDVYASTPFREYSVGAESIIAVYRDNHTAYRSTGADIKASILIDGKAKYFWERYPKELADELMDNYEACRAARKVLHVNQ